MRKILAYFIMLLFPVLLTLLYFNFYESSGDQWSVQCFFYDQTGYLCPGCGGQRAFSHLLHGHFLEALRCNALIIILLPIIIACYVLLGQIYLVGDKRWLKYLNLKPAYAYFVLIVLFLFFVLRNIPLFPFTYLAP